MKKISSILFYINACSLGKTFDDLEPLLKCPNKIFDTVAVSEARITKKNVTDFQHNFQNYSFEFTPTESYAGETLLYIANHLSYKPRTKLSLKKENQLESTFIQIINSRKSKIIVGCLYKHPNIGVSDFNKTYLNTLLDKLSKEN